MGALALYNSLQRFRQTQVQVERDGNRGLTQKPEDNKEKDEEEQGLSREEKIEARWNRYIYLYIFCIMLSSALFPNGFLFKFDFCIQKLCLFRCI